MYLPTARRCVDILLGISALVIASPVIAAMVFLARYESGLTGMFYQERFGLHAKPFHIWKIRTLDKDFRKLPYAGALRNAGADELPQLVNIVKGEMSFFGPRPFTRLSQATGLDRKYAISPGLIEPGTVASKELRVDMLSNDIAALTDRYVEKRLAGDWCLGSDLNTALRAIRLILGRRIDAPNDHAGHFALVTGSPTNSQLSDRSTLSPAPATSSLTGRSGPA